MNKYIHFDCKQFERFLGDCCGHYEKTAPQVLIYLESVNDRLLDRSLTLEETIKVLDFYNWDEGGWMVPNYAANFSYHLMNRFGGMPKGQALASF